MAEQRGADEQTSRQAPRGGTSYRILAAQTSVLPKNPAGKAARYTLALWNKLTLFLEYPVLELSNNLAENSMRPIAIGRKNWSHVPKVAAIFSIVESCRRLGLPIPITSPLFCLIQPARWHSF